MSATEDVHVWGIPYIDFVGYRRPRMSMCALCSCHGLLYMSIDAPRSPCMSVTGYVGVSAHEDGECVMSRVSASICTLFKSTTVALLGVWSEPDADANLPIQGKVASSKRPSGDAEGHCSLTAMPRPHRCHNKVRRSFERQFFIGGGF